jgi:hypothetical protein
VLLSIVKALLGASRGEGQDSFKEASFIYIVPFFHKEVNAVVQKNGNFHKKDPLAKKRPIAMARGFFKNGRYLDKRFLWGYN